MSSSSCVVPVFIYQFRMVDGSVVVVVGQVQHKYREGRRERTVNKKVPPAFSFV